MPKKGEKSGKKTVLRIKKKNLATAAVVVGIIIVAVLIIFLRNSGSGAGVSASVAKCIGQRSAVYVQLGCSHCADQEAMFGDSWKYMNSTDCYYYPQNCSVMNITGTPTWIVKGKYYLGVQSIDTLKNLTGC